MPQIPASAKINIGLHIVGKRADGYHLLESLFYPVRSLYDTVTVEAMEGEACTVEMPGFEGLSLQDNLCYKAWAALRSAFPGQVGGVHIRVDKGIPAGAGLGGGSSDAAAVLRLLREIFGLTVTDAALAAIGGKLGADVAFFVYDDGPRYATDIGTVLQPFALDLSGYELRVETLPVHSSTVEAYRNYAHEPGRHATALASLLKQPVATWRGRVLNDLEANVFRRLPEVEACKTRLYGDGAVFAAMTGSGSACFGLFETGA